MADERNLYRAQRRSFIAACEAAHVETIARVQPGMGADGKPLFTDTAALGERLATRATLVVGNNAHASAAQIALLKLPPPPGDRLVLVHALDPAHFGGPADPAWALATLAAVATEDLSKVTALTLMDLAGGFGPVARKALPGCEITITDLSRTKF
jgi:Protein of unknown function (DUF2817)